jgi:hypothetical protein
MNQLMTKSRAVSSQINSIFQDNKKMIIILMLLAIAYFAYKNCQCKNPVDDLKKMFDRVNNEEKK